MRGDLSSQLNNQSTTWMSASIQLIYLFRNPSKEDLLGLAFSPEASSFRAEWITEFGAVFRSYQLRGVWIK